MCRTDGIQNEARFHFLQSWLDGNRLNNGQNRLLVRYRLPLLGSRRNGYGTSSQYATT